MPCNVYSEICEHFRGYALLELANVELLDGGVTDKERVERLLKEFKLQGCRRDDETHAISVMVDSDVFGKEFMRNLDRGSSCHVLPSERLRVKATCLRGKHRVLAANRHFQESDRWWVAKLYDFGQWTYLLVRWISKVLTTPLSGLPDAAQNHIRCEYRPKIKPTDGEIFRQVLDAERRSDAIEAARWSQMLTPRKQRNLREIRRVDEGRLLAAFTPLLPYIALWVDLQPGALNRVLPLRCREARLAI